MAVPHHLQFINPIPRHDAEQSFELFPMLTVELRLSIWEYAVQHNRLIKVIIEPSAATETSETPAYSTTNRLNKVVSGNDYTIAVQSLQFHIKLLWVNREARRVARRFYRVQIACYLRRAGEMHVQVAREHLGSKVFSTFYFNPEHDILHVAHQPRVCNFIAFLHDLRAYDPKDVGLLSLAPESALVSDLSYFKPLPEGPARTSFVHTLSRLQRIIWVVSSPIGRGIMSLFSNTPTVGFRFIHSMPIMSANASFDVLAPDPRPIQSELQYVATASSDPGNISLMWRDFLGKWGVIQPRPAQQQVLFAFTPWVGDPAIQDAESAQSYLRREDDCWLRTQQVRSSIILQKTGRVPIEGPEELARAVRPAFGFWLFPIEALKDPERHPIVWSQPVFDLRGHEPELALVHLY